MIIRISRSYSAASARDHIHFQPVGTSIDLNIAIGRSRRSRSRICVPESMSPHQKQLPTIAQQPIASTTVHKQKLSQAPVQQPVHPVAHAAIHPHTQIHPQPAPVAPLSVHYPYIYPYPYAVPPQIQAQPFQYPPHLAAYAGAISPVPMPLQHSFVQQPGIPAPSIPTPNASGLNAQAPQPIPSTAQQPASSLQASEPHTVPNNSLKRRYSDDDAKQSISSHQPPSGAAYRTQPYPQPSFRPVPPSSSNAPASTFIAGPITLTGADLQPWQTRTSMWFQPYGNSPSYPHSAAMYTHPHLAAQSAAYPTLYPAHVNQHQSATSTLIKPASKTSNGVHKAFKSASHVSRSTSKSTSKPPKSPSRSKSITNGTLPQASSSEPCIKSAPLPGVSATASPSADHVATPSSSIGGMSDQQAPSVHSEKSLHNGSQQDQNAQSKIQNLETAIATAISMPNSQRPDHLTRQLSAPPISSGMSRPESIHPDRERIHEHADAIEALTSLRSIAIRSAVVPDNSQLGLSNTTTSIPLPAVLSNQQLQHRGNQDAYNAPSSTPTSTADQQSTSHQPKTSTVVSDANDAAATMYSQSLDRRESMLGDAMADHVARLQVNGFGGVVSSSCEDYPADMDEDVADDEQEESDGENASVNGMDDSDGSRRSARSENGDNTDKNASSNGNSTESNKSIARRYQCQYCMKRFSRPSSLTTHVYTHTGERPFRCQNYGCGRAFSVLSNLRRHSRVCQKNLSRRLAFGYIGEKGELAQQFPHAAMAHMIAPAIPAFIPTAPAQAISHAIYPSIGGVAPVPITMPVAMPLHMYGPAPGYAVVPQPVAPTSSAQQPTKPAQPQPIATTVASAISTTPLIPTTVGSTVVADLLVATNAASAPIKIVPATTAIPSAQPSISPVVSPGSSIMPVVGALPQSPLVHAAITSSIHGYPAAQAPVQPSVALPIVPTTTVTTIASHPQPTYFQNLPASPAPPMQPITTTPLIVTQSFAQTSPAVYGSALPTQPAVATMPLTYSAIPYASNMIPNPAVQQVSPLSHTGTYANVPMHTFGMPTGAMMYQSSSYPYCHPKAVATTLAASRRIASPTSTMPPSTVPISAASYVYAYDVAHGNTHAMSVLTPLSSALNPASGALQASAVGPATNPSTVPPVATVSAPVGSSMPLEAVQLANTDHVGAQGLVSNGVVQHAVKPPASTTITNSLAAGAPSPLIAPSLSTAHGKQKSTGSNHSAVSSANGSITASRTDSAIGESIGSSKTSLNRSARPAMQRIAPKPVASRDERVHVANGSVVDGAIHALPMHHGYPQAYLPPQMHMQPTPQYSPGGAIMPAVPSMPHPAQMHHPMHMPAVVNAHHPLPQHYMHPHMHLPYMHPQHQLPIQHVQQAAVATCVASASATKPPTAILAASGAQSVVGAAPALAATTHASSIHPVATNRRASDPADQLEHADPPRTAVEVVV